jgi:hypothetical protein
MAASKQKRKTTSASKTSINIKWVVTTVVTLVLLATAGYLLAERTALSRDLADERQSTNDRFNLMSNEMDEQKALLRPAVSAKDNTVAIPELNITLPYNTLTKTLQYSTDESNNIRVTSTLVVDHAPRQLDCGELLRVSFVNTTVYDPWEEVAGEVKLADGRTLHIIAARAYENNEASTKGCVDIAWKSVTPLQMADEFKKAQSY